MEEMTVLEPIAAADLDRKLYVRLLAKFAPKVIETATEHDAALAIVESLMEKGEDNLSPEEGRRNPAGTARRSDPRV
jgi:hypothetical protein